MTSAMQSFFDDDEITGVDEQLGREVETLHATGGDDETIVARRVRCGGEIVDEQLQQTRFALGGSVGERRVVEDLTGDPTELLGRHGLVGR